MMIPKDWIRLLNSSYAYSKQCLTHQYELELYITNLLKCSVTITEEMILKFVKVAWQSGSSNSYCRTDCDYLNSWQHCFKMFIRRKNWFRISQFYVLLRNSSALKKKKKKSKFIFLLNSRKVLYSYLANAEIPLKIKSFQREWSIKDQERNDRFSRCVFLLLISTKLCYLGLLVAARPHNTFNHMLLMGESQCTNAARLPK